jgi:hypothetical protein
LELITTKEHIYLDQDFLGSWLCCIFFALARSQDLVTRGEVLGKEGSDDGDVMALA